MKAESTIIVNIDPEMKKEVDELFDDIGLDTKSAIHLFLKQSLIARNIPFPIKKNKQKNKLKKKQLESLKKDRVPHNQVNLNEEPLEKSFINDLYD